MTYSRAVRRPNRGGARRIDLADALLAAYAAEGFTFPFLGLTRSTAEMTLITGDASALINHGSVGGSFTQGTAVNRPTWDGTDRSLDFDGTDYLVSDATYNAAAHDVCVLIARFQDSETAFRILGEFGDTSLALNGSCAIRLNHVTAGNVGAYARDNAISYAYASNAMSSYATLATYVDKSGSPDTGAAYIDGSDATSATSFGDITGSFATHDFSIAARASGLHSTACKIQAIGLAFGASAPSAGLLAQTATLLNGEFA